MANNNLGELVPPEGWSIKDKGCSYQMYVHIDGREQKEDPGSKPEGIVALANAIPDMGALSKLDVRGNCIRPAEEALLQGACDSKGISLRS
jgi:hypothetical protein